MLDYSSQICPFSDNLKTFLSNKEAKNIMFDPTTLYNRLSSAKINRKELINKPLDSNFNFHIVKINENIKYK